MASPPLTFAAAAIQPWLAPAPKARNALQVFFLTDANWLLGSRYHAEGGRDHGMLLGAGLFLWVVWTFATIPGYLAGALVTDPKRLGLDMLMPIFFAAMLVPLWKGARLAVPWAIAGVVALAAQTLLPGYAFIIAGALAGLIAGAAGPYAAILAMAVATYLCRASGVVLMSRVRLTPRVTRALRALPGSIVVATVAPLAAQAGTPAVAGVLIALATMIAVRWELAA